MPIDDHTKQKVYTVSIIMALVFVATVIVLFIVLKIDSKISSNRIKLMGAVTSNARECAFIGRSILKKKGTVADAAIATLLCEGVAHPHSLGIGGGFFATIYIKSKGTAESLIARETAPLAATENMFVNKTVEGGLAVAVPGEIKGYAALHHKYGKLDWATLIKPTIKLCLKGVKVSAYFAAVLKDTEDSILSEESLKETFVNPKTGKVYTEGNRVKRPKLAETLKMIAKNGESAIYGGGSIGKMLVHDIKSFGGIITEQDLKQYRVRWAPTASTVLPGFTVHSAPLPGSGPLLNLILNLIGYHRNCTEKILWHRIIEAFKHAYGLRTRLGDLEFEPNVKKLASEMSDKKFADKIFKKINDDKTFNDYNYYGAEYSEPNNHGTANIAVLGANGDAITMTSTINNVFGAKLRSPQTGIILNDEMDDFSTPGTSNAYGLRASPANFIKPKKMPLSSMAPTIIIDKLKYPCLLIGAAGGPKITTSVALVIIRHVFLNKHLNYSIQSHRLHHQLSPMVLLYETGFDQNILNSLEQKGHEIGVMKLDDGFSAVTGVSVFVSYHTEAVFDHRRPGSISYC